MKTLLNILLITAAAILSNNCSPTEPPDDKPPVEPDSTTQNFTFETFEFGDGYESNELNDVWIFDENNIWAVGYISDIATNNKPVNIIRWDGNKWFGFGGNLTTSGLTGIWAIDTNNIYLASGALRKYRNGNIQVIDLTHLSFTQGQGVHKLWGSSQSNIWGVGPWGTIVHFDGTAWSKIDFDEQWSFTSVTGNAETGVAYAIARNTSFVTIIVKLANNINEIVYQSDLQAPGLKSYGIKFLNDFLYLANSDFSNTLLWRYNILNNNIDNLYSLVSTTGIFKTTGEKEKDIYYWGSDYGIGKLIHYNGKRYKIFDLPKASITTGGAYTRGDISAVVGFANNKGYVTLVRREP